MNIDDGSDTGAPQKWLIKKKIWGNSGHITFPVINCFLCTLCTIIFHVSYIFYTFRLFDDGSDTGAQKSFSKKMFLSNYRQITLSVINCFLYT